MQQETNTNSELGVSSVEKKKYYLSRCRCLSSSGFHSNPDPGWERPLSKELCLASPLSAGSCWKTKGGTARPPVCPTGEHSRPAVRPDDCVNAANPPMQRARGRIADCVTHTFVNFPALRQTSVKQRSLLCGTDATQRRKQSLEDKIWTLVLVRCRWKRYPEILDAPLQITSQKV